MTWLICRNALLIISVTFFKEDIKSSKNSSIIFFLYTQAVKGVIIDLTSLWIFERVRPKPGIDLGKLDRGLLCLLYKPEAYYTYMILAANCKGVAPL